MATVFATVTTPGPPGSAGPPGYSPQYIVAAGAPGAGVGNNGDMYIDSSNGNVYGPKAGGAWGGVVCNIKGPAGAAGATGPAGYSPQYIVAAGAPGAGVGNNGDMYINSTTSDVYGPKTAGAWGAIQCNIKGVPGAQGPQGLPGVAYTPKGAWVAGTTYAQGDEVTYSSQLFIGLQGANTGNVPSSSPTWWQLVGSGGSQTPWLTNISGGGFQLTNVASIGIGITGAPLNPLQVHVAANQNLGVRTYAGRTSIGTFNDAGSAEVPLGFDASVFDFAGGNVGIGAPSPICKLSLGSDVTAHKLAIYDNGVQFYGFGMDSAQIRYEAGGGGGHNFYCNGSVFAATIAPNGFVGIGAGAAGPWAQEVISSQASAYPPPSLTSQSAAIWECGVNAGPGLAMFNAGSPSYCPVLQTRHQTVANNAYPLLINPLGGNVGIGGAPYTYGGAAAPLDVGVNTQGAINVLSLKCGIGATGDGPAIVFGQNTGSALQAQIQAYYDISTTGLGFKFNTWNGANLGERMRLTGPGFVGIGTTVPAAPLHVKVGTDQNLTVKSFSGVVQLEAVNDARSADVPLRIDASQYQLMSGNVGIGTTQVTTAKLTVAYTNPAAYNAASANSWATTLVQNIINTAGCAAGIGFSVTSTYPGNDTVAAGMAAVLISSAVDTQVDLAFITRPTGNVSAERMRITAAGLVGIGRTPTTYPLEVAGDVNCTGAFRVNGVALTAAMITNAVDSTGSYANPAWITSLAYAKITGAPAGGGLTTMATANPWLGTPTGSRALSTNYQNATGKPLWVSLAAVVTVGGSVTIYSDAASAPTTPIAFLGDPSTTAGVEATLYFWVLPGHYYRAQTAGTGASIAFWVEYN